jgi:hypothetical protein
MLKMWIYWVITWITHRETQELFTDASKEVGLEVNAEKAEHVMMSLSPEYRGKSGHKDN